MDRHLTSIECMLVRETMLRQEKMYKEQVQALHYLYEVQKTMMDELGTRNLSESIRPHGNTPQHHQFFPLKEELKKTGFPRAFDLEKLPDECLDYEQGLTDVKCDLELVLHSGSHDHPNADVACKRPRLACSEKKSPTTDFSTGQKELQVSPLKHHQQWLLDGARASKQPTSTSGFFQLEMPCDISQVPLRTPISIWEDSKVRYGNATPAVTTSQASLWYGQQYVSMQQNLHPWQVSGAAYFNGLTYSHLPVTLDGLANGTASSGLFSAATKRYVDGLQQADKQQRNGQLKNGYEASTGMNYMVPIEGLRKESNGTNGYRDTGKVHISGTEVETVMEVQNHFWANGVQASSTGNPSHAECQPKEKITEEVSCEEDVDKLAAMILVSLTLDKSHCERKESSPSLKNSVAWFADAIPTEGDDDMQVQEDASKGSPELDSFELATLNLKPVDEAEHLPTSRVELPDPSAAPAQTKAATNGSGRPTRLSKKQRDFRNDTLPSITSLSRQEITEDWQIMSGLLRYNESGGAGGGGGSGGGGGGTGQVDPSPSNGRRSGKFCSISRMERSNNSSSRIASPVSTLDHYGSPGKMPRRSSTSVAAAAAGGGSGDGGGVAAGLPWLVSWGESTRRKRKQRQRISAPVSHKLRLFAPSNAARICR